MRARRQRVRDTCVASLLAVLAAVSAPTGASAALLWTLTASPLAVATGVPTTFTLTASNMLLGRIECVVVDVPANFNIANVAIVGSTAGDSWLARREGNEVTVWTTSGGDRLELLDSVTFTIGATAVAAGSLTWPASAYDRPDCTGSGSLLGVPPAVLVTGPAVTPSPSPSPAPTPASTPTPTPTPVLPLPTLSLPTIPSPSIALPTIGQPTPPPATPRPDPTPSAPSPESTPTAPSEGPEPTADGASGPTFPGTNGSGGAPPETNAFLTGSAEAPGADRSPAAPRLAFDEPALELDVASLGVLGGVDVWAVPAATIAGPGLVVLLWVAIQAGGVSLWVPAVRRLRGEGEAPARSPRARVA